MTVKIINQCHSNKITIIPRNNHHRAFYIELTITVLYIGSNLEVLTSQLDEIWQVNLRRTCLCLEERDVSRYYTCILKNENI